MLFTLSIWYRSWNNDCLTFFRVELDLGPWIVGCMLYITAIDEFEGNPRTVRFRKWCTRWHTV